MYCLGLRCGPTDTGLFIYPLLFKCRDPHPLSSLVLPPVTFLVQFGALESPAFRNSNKKKVFVALLYEQWASCFKLITIWETEH